MSARRQQQRPDRSTAEWVSFGISLAIVAAILAAIGYVWATGSDAADVTVVEVAPARQEADDRYYVDVTVRNVGGDTAEGIQVVSELTFPGEPPAEADQSIDFLSGDEETTVVFTYDRDPAEGELDIRVSGYRSP